MVHSYRFLYPGILTLALCKHVFCEIIFNTKSRHSVNHTFQIYPVSGIILNHEIHYPVICYSLT